MRMARSIPAIIAGAQEDNALCFIACYVANCTIHFVYLLHYDVGVLICAILCKILVVGRMLEGEESYTRLVYQSLSSYLNISFIQFQITIM